MSSRAALTLSFRAESRNLGRGFGGGALSTGMLAPYVLGFFEYPFARPRVASRSVKGKAPRERGAQSEVVYYPGVGACAARRYAAGLSAFFAAGFFFPCIPLGSSGR